MSKLDTDNFLNDIYLILKCILLLLMLLTVIAITTLIVVSK